jgi:hypothetical protein
LTISLTKNERLKLITVHFLSGKNNTQTSEKVVFSIADLALRLPKKKSAVEGSGRIVLTYPSGQLHPIKSGDKLL